MQNTDNGPSSRAGRVRLILILAILVVGVGFVAIRAGVLGGDSAQQGGPMGGMQGDMPPMPVDMAVAQVGDVVDAVQANGRIEAVDAVDLAPDEPGRVTALLFREGQEVEAGTPLVRIDDAMLRAQAERARADLDLAQQQLARVQRLRAERAAAPADLERAEAAARSAAAALAVLELQIERTTVRAPFSGVVGQRHVSVGDYVTVGTPLLSLQTMDPQHVVIAVPERYAGGLSRGQTIEFTVAAETARVFRATVDFIDPTVQAESRTIVVKALAQNRDRRLKPGMFVDARLATRSRSGAILVPEDAIQPLRTANVVWAMSDGRASRRVVQLGTRRNGLVEILSGVSAGEMVVVGGLERMAEGMPIAPRPAATGDTAAAPAPDSASPTG